jgi:predicted nucleic acid-binding protein
MILLDTNVVLAAQRSDHPHHGVARPWLAHIVDRRKSFGVRGISSQRVNG